MMGGMSTGERGRLSALDGLRGVAVLLVIACHAAVPGTVLAGQAGVTVFFVLSGFLITGILLRPAPLRRFWVRRVRRLAPALVVMLAVLLPVYLVAGWTFGQYTREALPPLLYVANFDEIRRGWTVPFGHLWSLSVEEQFYAVFPFVVLALRRRPRAVLVVAAVGALVGAGARVVLALDPSVGVRAQVGTEANVFALLLGAVCAAAVALGWRPKTPRLMFAAGVVLVAATSFGPVPPGAALFAVPTAAGAALVIVGVLDGCRALEVTALRFFGQVSYGWYLWHLPLMALVADPVTHTGTATKLVASAVALGVAVLSWRYVEQPILRGRSGRDREVVEAGQRRARSAVAVEPVLGLR